MSKRTPKDSITADSNPEGINQYTGGGGRVGGFAPPANTGAGKEKYDKAAALSVVRNMAAKAHGMSAKAKSHATHKRAAEEHDRVAVAYHDLGKTKDAKAHERMRDFHLGNVNTLKYYGLKG